MQRWGCNAGNLVSVPGQRLIQGPKDEMEGKPMKKLFKCLVKLGMVAGIAVVALQFQPVREAVNKLGIVEL